VVASRRSRLGELVANAGVSGTVAEALVLSREEKSGAWSCLASTAWPAISSYRSSAGRGLEDRASVSSTGPEKMTTSVTTGLIRHAG
jgi:hypothetical protein